MPLPLRPQQTRRHRISSRDEVRGFFAARGKRVISFAGFGELGYEEAGIVERVAQAVLGGEPPRGVLVNCGTLLRVGGEDGIAGVYRVGRRLGIETSGIHPGIALGVAETHIVSPDEDHAFFVEDATWGGFVDGGREASPTLQAILEISDELIVIGGGRHAADELEAFWRAGKPVRYVRAEMNRRATREWCARAGVEIVDYRGAAHGVWLALTRGTP